jgi:hypothetical protein
MLYTKLGKPAEAAKQRELLGVIDKLGAANGEKGNRQLAVNYTDVNRNLDRAVALAQGELQTRKEEAEDASAQALARNTAEPVSLPHAGLIAMASGRTAELNPNFAIPDAG